MYFKLKQNIIFRNYDSFGYITDNRNYGYEKKAGEVIGDKIISQSGSMFLTVLKREPQNINEIIEKISKIYPDIESKTIAKDAIDFFSVLEKEGFILSGRTKKECNRKDIHFKYKSFETYKREQKSCSSVNTEDFFNEKFNGKPQLNSLHIEVTSRCNERCIHCYIPKDNNNSEIEPGLFYKIIDQCRDMNLLHLTISGGEPLLHRNFCDFLAKCNEHNLSVTILSNLTLLNNKILKEMKNNPILGVQTSLYSMDHNIHDEITNVSGSFEKTKKSIKKIIDNNIPIQINCPIIMQNKGCFLEVIEWANKMNISIGSDYSIIGRYDHSIDNLKCRLEINDILEVMKKKSIINQSYCEDIKKEAHNRANFKPDDYVCSVCRSSICINEKGDVYPCVGWQGFTVGSVKENTLKDIWNNSLKVNYLRTLRRGIFLKCNQCPDREYCDICLVRNSNENKLGDPLVISNYFCSIAKLKRQFVNDNKCMNELVSE